MRTFIISLYGYSAMGDDGVRLNRFLAEAGVASRRGSDRIIEEGRVTVDGRPAVLGDRVTEGTVVCVDGKAVSKVEEVILLAFYKPEGITCTANPDDETNIVDYIDYPKRIYSIGRLDKDSEGLILMTNDGDLANRVMRSREEHEKEYIVTVDKEVTSDFLRGMAGGVPILDGRITKKCEVTKTGPNEFRIILKQGLNRQIRRMCEHFGYNVVKLKRTRVMNVTLGNLKPGRYRDLTKGEKEELYMQTGLL